MSSTSYDARSLLRDDAGAGYPPAYVLARLRGRRTALAAPPLAPSPDDAATDEHIWSRFLDELSWLFRQMDARMRAANAPVFGLFEMKTIVLCLRNASLDRVEPRRRLLQRSLLAPAVREILGRHRPVGAIVAALGPALGGLSRAFDDLDSRYFEAGLKGCEDALMRMYLEAVMAARLAPPARHFLARFIDFRNLMALYKHLRWELKGPVVLIHGGTTDVAAFRDALVDEDGAALDALIVRATGVRISAATEIGVETKLLTALSNELNRARRQRGGDWLVPDYVWRAYVHARNLAVRHHGAAVEPSVLAREMIA
jgi:hypothetical protein